MARHDNDIVRIKAFNSTRRYWWPAKIKVTYRILSEDKDLNWIQAYKVLLNWNKNNAIITRDVNLQELIKSETKYTSVKAKEVLIYQLGTKVPINNKEYEIKTIYYVKSYSSTYKKQPETLYWLDWYGILSDSQVVNLFNKELEWTDEK